MLTPLWKIRSRIAAAMAVLFLTGSLFSVCQGCVAFAGVDEAGPTQQHCRHDGSGVEAADGTSPHQQGHQACGCPDQDAIATDHQPQSSTAKQLHQTSTPLQPGVPADYLSLARSETECPTVYRADRAIYPPLERFCVLLN